MVLKGGKIKRNEWKFQERLQFDTEKNFPKSMPYVVVSSNCWKYPHRDSTEKVLESMKI